jgi:hypothetical protein
MFADVAHMIRRLHLVEQLFKRTWAFSRIEDAIAAMRAGQMVIVVDDEDRENEGDLTIARICKEQKQ